MTAATLPPVTELRRLPSPAATPQALAWHGGALWMGSRDLRCVYGINVETWSVFEENEAPGVPWAAVSLGDRLRFTIGEGPEDDRHLRSYVPGVGFADDDRVECPDLTGSYLSYDGSHVYLSQWYRHRILKLDSDGEILRAIDVGEEICGHVFVDGLIYILRGTEQGNEEWRLARLDPHDEPPQIEDVASVPFQCRSLAFDGARFWSSHRAADEIVCFAAGR
ncbi:MAG TPA: hypothetical protein VK993_07175 [Chthoniobacterales bacterium]|nr:hypothetical protein [Chthoniobacterales bacterium]